MHSQNFRDRNYRIPLTDFVNVMKDTIISDIEKTEFHHKEAIYNYLVKTFSNLVPNYCENACPDINSYNPEYVIHRLEEEFSHLKDVRKYIEVINPGVITWTDHCDYLSHASIDALRRHIVYAFYCSRNADAIKVQHDGITFQSHLSQAKKQTGSSSPFMYWSEYKPFLRNDVTKHKKQYQYSTFNRREHTLSDNGYRHYGRFTKRLH